MGEMWGGGWCVDGDGDGGERARYSILAAHDKERLGKAKLARRVRNHTKPIGVISGNGDRLVKPDLF